MSATGELPMEREPLTAYAYSYPHKSSYRPLSPVVPLSEAWRDEDASSLSLYVHVPFCEMRCGFCNLFTQSQPGAEAVAAYLATLKRQMRVVREAVPAAQFQQFAVGGGTPTFLSAAELATLLSNVQSTFDCWLRYLATSVETSPATATPDRLQVLRDWGVQRISLGVQSFANDELGQLGRPQKSEDVHQALANIRSCGFPELNIDLIYGGMDQTRRAWRQSLRESLRYEPEEIYVYPLYVRPHTGLARRGRSAAEHRSDLYREARDLLCASGYVQLSLRNFRLPRCASSSAYACQRDGMIGLGCGARSYTRRLHYATRFAATQAGVRAILQQWVSQSDAELALATHGYWLSEDEQRRRYLIMSLLQAAGMQLNDYRARFSLPPDAEVHLPDMELLIERGWLEHSRTRLKLTASGLEHSDEVGPLLYSELVRDRLREFAKL